MSQADSLCFLESLVEVERGREPAVRFDVLLQGSDLLLRSANCVRASDEAAIRLNSIAVLRAVDQPPNVGGT
jgi:hypothetical protein